MSNVWFHILLIAATAATLITSATSSARAQDVEDNLSVFKSPEAEARYLEAYNATLSQWPVPYESLFIPTRFGVTHVIASGPKDAPPLVLLHAATASATQWFPDAGNLSRSYRIYALDTIGDAGMSKVDRPPQNRSDYALWLSDVLDGINIEKADLVGSSYGGWIAMNTALYAPERVNKMVMLSPANALAPFELSYVARIAITTSFPNRWAIEHISVRPLFAKEPNGPFLEQLLEAAQNGQFKLVFPTEFTDDELRQIETSALLLVGDKEALTDPNAALNRCRVMQNCQAELVPGAGHIMNQDQPGEVDVRIIDYFKGP